MAYYSPSNFSPDCSLGYLARRVNQLAQIGLEPVFAEEGLTNIQWSALISIYFARGKTCAELARDLSYDKGATTRLIDTLEARGWVVRRRESEDRRVIALAITPEGEALAHRCRLRVIDCWNKWLDDWRDEEVGEAVAILQRLRDRMEQAVIG